MNKEDFQRAIGVVLVEATKQLWVQQVKTKWHPPEGLFTKDGETIARTLLKASDSAGQAMKRLMFYINRAGEKLENKKELMKAKEIIAKAVDKEQAEEEKK